MKAYLFTRRQTKKTTMIYYLSAVVFSFGQIELVSYTTIERLLSMLDWCQIQFDSLLLLPKCHYLAIGKRTARI